ncbi:MAG: homoserine dehydrogenase [Clostridiales bacterium]|nr:homoserine dehydrogenase [Clostridiales bacterium]
MVRKIALLGFGTVGRGVYHVLKKQNEELPYKVGARLEVTKVLVRDKSKPREDLDQDVLVDNWKEIVEDPSIDIVIEVMGGMEPAKTYITEALKAGKHVVTANKDLIAEFGPELMEIAQEHHCDLMFEAAVAGGIPIIRPLKQCLSGNEITEVMGIINGTTNFILSKMASDGMDFSQALQMATELGYAEADPTADIEGYDAGRKIAIMASIAFHTAVKFADVYTEGISKITASDIQYAREMGFEIKLIGVAKNTATGIEARVHPMLMPKSHPLASITDSFNAVFIHGDAVDDCMFYGRGAGMYPTASAIVGDVIDVARNMSFRCNGRIGCFCYKHAPIKDIREIESCYFIRMEVADRSGTLAGVTAVFGNNSVSIAQMIQEKRKDGIAEVVFITDQVQEKMLQDAITILEGMAIVKRIFPIFRVYR